MVDPRSDLAGIRVSAAFVFVGSFDAVERLVHELEGRADVRLVYTKTSIGRLRIVPEVSPG